VNQKKLSPHNHRMLASTQTARHKPHPRSKFSSAEDQALTDVVHQHGTKDWTYNAKFLPGRNARQCRDRWLNYLSPTVGNGPWSPEEERLLIAKREEFGTAWKHIASFFPGRTDINVKSRWLIIQRRVRKVVRVQSVAAAAPAKQAVSTPNVQALPWPGAPPPAPPAATGQENSSPPWDAESVNEIWSAVMTNDNRGQDFLLEGWF
jgi:hypothetical protein